VVPTNVRHGIGTDAGDPGRARTAPPKCATAGRDESQPGSCEGFFATAEAADVASAASDAANANTILMSLLDTDLSLALRVTTRRTTPAAFSHRTTA
jgi:hypothetical protein